MPLLVLVVMLQRIALWETLGKVGWSDAYLKCSRISTRPEILWHTAYLACVYIQHTTYYILPN